MARQELPGPRRESQAVLVVRTGLFSGRGERTFSCLQRDSQPIREAQEPLFWARTVSPGRDIGGEGGTLIGIHKLGCSCYIFPLSLICSSCNRSRNRLGGRVLEVARAYSALRAELTKQEVHIYHILFTLSF